MTAVLPFRPVFSLWAWLVMTPHFLVQINGIDATLPISDLPVGIGVAIDVALILALAFLGLGRIERLLRHRPAARWSFVAVALAGCAVLRPLLLTALQLQFGLELAPTPMWSRFFANLIVLGTGCLVLYFVLVGLERNLAARDRLRLVEADLETQATLTEAYRDEVMERFREETAKPVIDALGRLFARELGPRELADELDWVSLVVVPPTSDRADGAALHEALDDLQPVPEEPAPASGIAFEPVRHVLSPSRIDAAPTWVVGAIVVALLPAQFTLAPVPAVLLAGATAALASMLLGWLLRRIPLPQRPSRAILVLTVAYLLIGAVATVILTIPNLDDPLIWAYGVYGTISHGVVTVAVAVVLSSFREIRGHRTQITAAIVAAERRLARARDSLSALSERIAHTLREGVLADLVATSERLRAGTAEADVLEALFGRVETALGSMGSE